jgi:hypothetical protein
MRKRKLVTGNQWQAASCKLQAARGAEEKKKKKRRT